jgi:hypothetical protein
LSHKFLTDLQLKNFKYPNLKLILRQKTVVSSIGADQSNENSNNRKMNNKDIDNSLISLKSLLCSMNKDDLTNNVKYSYDRLVERASSNKTNPVQSKPSMQVRSASAGARSSSFLQNKILDQKFVASKQMFENLDQLNNKEKINQNNSPLLQNPIELNNIYQQQTSKYSINNNNNDKNNVYLEKNNDNSKHFERQNQDDRRNDQNNKALTR